MAVAIYARKSTESEERQVQSLEDQLTALRALAARERIVAEVEIIEAKSAKEPGVRPEFQRLMAAVQAGEVDGILVWQIDRLCRNMVDGGVVSHLLQTGKLRFIRTPERIYRPEDSALLMAIETGMATSFIQNLQRNVRRGMEGKALRGWFPGPAPFGYLNNRLTKEIEPDPERFHILRLGWEMIADKGYTVAEVRRELASLGLTDLSGKPGMSNGTAYRLFRNRFYTGVLPYGGKWLPGKHPVMVSAEDFERVRIAIAGAPKTNDVRLKHPYAGVFTCPRCGCAITAETKVKRSKSHERRYTYYRCTGVRGCSKHAVTSEALDKAIGSFVEKVSLDPGAARWMRSEVALSAERSVLDNAASIADLARQGERLERRLARIRDLRIAGELTAEEFATERAASEQALEEARNNLDVARKLGSTVDQRILRKLDLLESARGWRSMSTIAKRTFLRSFAEKAFLTLERLEFVVDPVMAKIASIELGDVGSQSFEGGDFALSFSMWYSFWDEIRTNEADQVLGTPKQRLPGRIVVELPSEGHEASVRFLGPAPPCRLPCADATEMAGEAAGGEDPLTKT